jgi:integrase
MKRYPMNPMAIKPSEKRNGICALLNLHLKYVHEYRDRHGRLRRYFRKGSRRAALKGEPGSPEFMAVYAAALAASTTPIKRAGKTGTVDAVIRDYYRYSGFTGLAAGTQQHRRAILERFRKGFGNLPIAGVERQHIASLIRTMKPFAAKNWLKTLRPLMLFAIELELRSDDPCQGIAPPKSKAGRIHTWSEAEIAQFEAHHPVGTQARLAMALLLYSGQRKSDVIRMGANNIIAGRLYFTQAKTMTPLSIPVHAELQRVLDASSLGLATFLEAPHSHRPYLPARFGHWFREMCDAAGLPHCTSHGLRKAQCRRLAEAGCSAPEIAAISGHKSLKEVSRYIEAASQRILADRAFSRTTNGHTPIQPNEFLRSG